MGIEIARLKRRPCVDFLHAPGRWLAAVASSRSPRALVPIQTSRLAGEVLEVRVVDLALAYLFIGQGEDVLEPEREARRRQAVTDKKTERKRKLRAIRMSQSRCMASFAALRKPLD